MRRSGHIFLSYRSAEADFALRLAADLKNAGVQLWMDRLDIQPGDDWNRAIVQNLDSCRGLIAVLSPGYVNSDYCKRELARAGRMRRQIFPVLLRPIAEAEWPLEIERLQQIDFTLWQDEERYYERLKELLWILHKRASDQTGSAPNHETRYLTTLIAELEARQGVVSYVELAGYSTETAEQRPQPTDLDAQQLAAQYSVDAELEAAEAEPTRHPLANIREAIERYPRFTLIGALGAGKTTTLQRLALEAARARLAAPHQAPLPLLLNLASWGADLPLADFLRSKWLFEDDLFRSLQNGRTLLYLDGLNEMGAAGPAKAEELRTWLQGAEAPERVIVTCRAHDYVGELDLGLPIVHAEPMDAGRVRQFVLGQLGEDDGERFLHSLEARRGESAARQLDRLAHNPFLLQTMLTVHRATPGGELPRNRGALLRELVHALWEREAVRQTPGWCSEETMEAAFAQLAFALIDQDLPQELPTTEAIESLGDARLLPAGQGAQLLEARAGRVRFSHQLIQEYFAARGLQAAGLPTRLRYPEWDAEGERIANKWDDVIITLCGIVPQADVIVQTIAAVDPFLAEACIQSGVTIQEAARSATIQSLQDFLEKDDGAARLAATHALGRLADEGTIQPLLASLRDHDWEVRRSAAQALKRIRQPAVPGLLEALRDWDHVMSEAAGTALRQIGEPAVSGLLHALNDEDWRVRRGAAWALGEIADAAAVPALVTALSDQDSLVQRAAAVALGWIRDPAATPELLRALYDGDWRVRMAASEALGWLGEPAVPGLLEILNGPRHQDTLETRRLAIEALAGARCATALVPLLYALEVEDDPSLRAAAAAALGSLGDARALPYLRRALSDERPLPAESERVCDYAAEALAAFPTDSGTPGMLRDWQEQRGETPPQHSSPPPALAAEPLAIALPSAGDEMSQLSTEELLASLAQLHAGDWQTRQSAVTALGERGDVSAVPALLEAIKDDSSHVRWSAVRALSAIDDRKVVPGLLSALRDEDAYVIDAASEALGRIGRAAQPGLLRALKERRPEVRGAAVEVLGRIGNSKAVRPLRKLLGDRARSSISGRRLAELAAEALERIGSQEALAAIRSEKNQETQPPPTLSLPRPKPPRLTAPSRNDPALSPHLAANQTVERSAPLPTSSLINALLNSEGAALQDAARQLRAAANQLAAASGATALTEWRAALAPALEHETWFVRWVAVEGLALAHTEMGPQAEKAAALLPSLEPRLRDPSYGVRLTAIRAIAALKHGSALPALAQALDDESPSIQEAAAQGLGHLSDERAALSLLPALTREDTFVRRSAALALAQLAAGGILPSSAISSLQAAMQDADAAVRLAATRAIQRMPTTPQALETLTDTLIENLSDKERAEESGESVSAAAAAALARLNSGEAQAALDRWRGMDERR